MWAIAMGVHLWEQIPLRLPRSLADVAAWVLLGAIGFAIWARRQPEALVLVAGVQLVEWMVTVPLVPDHWMLVAAVNAIIVVSGLRAYRLDGAILAPRLIRIASPWMAAALLVAYSFAALAKYNNSFLDDVSGCVVFLGGIARQFLPFLPADDAWPFLFLLGPIVIETSVPILLLWKKTRRLGIIVSLVFHFSLSATGVINVFDFTATVFALFIFLFTSDSTPQRMLELVAQFGERYPVFGKLGIMLGTLFPLLFVVTAALTSLAGEKFGLSRYFVYNAYALVIITTVWVAGRGARHDDWVRLKPERFSPVSAAVVGLIALNGLAPYLGLKAVSSFTMFSNLSTEAGESNHLFIPDIAIFDGLDEMVVVLDSDSTSLEEADGRSPNSAYPLLGLRTVAARDPDMSLTILRNGEEVFIERAGDDPIIGERPGFLAQKFGVFRFVENGPEQGCRN